MKPLFLFLLLLTFCSLSKAQENYLNKSSDYIRADMKIVNYELFATGKTDNGEKKYISYSLKSRAFTFFFNINEDVCVTIMEFDPKNLLETILYNLNKNYIKTDNSIWETFDNKIKIKVDTEKLPKSVVLIYTLNTSSL